MNFILRLTFREVRSSWRRLLFFFLSIAIGVGSVVALRSLVQNIGFAVAFDARELLTADIEISSTNEFEPSEIAKIEDSIAKFSIVDGRSEAITTASMARPIDAENQRVRLVELKGVDRAFPLVGNFLLDGGQKFDYRLIEGGGAVASRILIEDLDLKIGDKIRLAEGEFRINATFDREPGGNSGFRLGPRVFIEKKAFDDAGITRGSGRIRRRILLRTTTDPASLVNDLRESLRGTTLQVQSYRESQENLGEQFGKTENYLALTGLLILVLGGIGVWNVSRAFVEQKRKTVAILKCVGATGNRILSIYFLQITILGLIGSLFGVLLAQIGLLSAGAYFRESLPVNMPLAVSASASGQGIFLGVAISLIFSTLPLLQIRHLKPSLLLNDDNNAHLRLDRTRWLGPRMRHPLDCFNLFGCHLSYAQGQGAPPRLDAPDYTPHLADAPLSSSCWWPATSSGPTTVIFSRPAGQRYVRPTRTCRPWTATATGSPRTKASPTRPTIPGRCAG